MGFIDKVKSFGPAFDRSSEGFQIDLLEKVIRRKISGGHNNDRGAPLEICGLVFIRKFEKME